MKFNQSEERKPVSGLVNFALVQKCNSISISSLTRALQLL